MFFVQDFIFVAVNAATLAEARVEIFNLQGQKLYENTTSLGNSLQIKLGNVFSSGIYFVKLTNGKVIRHEKIMLR